MKIETERLVITEFTMDMAEAVHLTSLDEDNRRFVPDEVFETIEDAAETIEFLMSVYKSGEGPLVYPILLKNNIYIGYVQAVPFEDGTYEIGYHIGADYTKYGYATEAVKAFLPVIMPKLAIERIQGICLSDNKASVKVMERCGFIKEYEGIGFYQDENRPICRFYFDLPLFNAGVTSKLAQYIHDEIFPQYAKNDKGHQLEHIHYVISRSLKFMEQFDNLSADMVYTIAAYHDIAHHINKDEHEILSAKALQNDVKLKLFFTDEQITMMKEAVEDHRASLEYEPRNDYGKIVSSADRSTDIDGFFKRTHAYSLKHFPEYTELERMKRCYQHMKDKYGSGGYAKNYVIDKEYIQFLKTIRELLNDWDAFEAKYRAITE